MQCETYLIHTTYLYVSSLRIEREQTEIIGDGRGGVIVIYIYIINIYIIYISCVGCGQEGIINNSVIIMPILCGEGWGFTRVVAT